MNNKKRFLAGLLFLAITVALCVSPAFAANVNEPTNVNVVYFEDGSYIVKEVTTNISPMSRATNIATGYATTTYYNASDEAMWDLTVHGRFSYNGTSATALEASYSYNIYNSGWSFKSANAYCKDNQAIVDSVFVKAFFISRQAIVTLTCSPTGVLS